jgi:hypothetical protein
MLCFLLPLTRPVVTPCLQVVVDKASGGEQAMLADLAPGSTVEVSPAGGSCASNCLGGAAAMDSAGEVSCAGF